MGSETLRATDEAPPPDERPDDGGRSRALVPVGRRRVWHDPGPRMLAALCYFAWLGWVTAPLPLLLLSSRRMRRARGVPYHLFASVGWNLLVIAVRLFLLGIAALLDMYGGARSEAITSALTMVHLVVLLSFALLLSCWYAIEALMVREISLPPLSRWAQERADHFLGRD